MAMQGRAGMALTISSYVNCKSRVAVCYSYWALVVVCIFAAGGGQAAQWEVGGSAGWTLPSIGNVNYSDWAASQTFVVGDTLFFNYSKEYHNVMVVTKLDYEACEASNAISTYDDGATLFKLDRSGSFYFLCGVPSHCTDGQKVVVKVRKHALTSSSSPPSTATSQGSNFIPNTVGSPSPNSFPPETSIEDSSTTLGASSYLIMLTITINFLLNSPPTFSC